MPQDRLTSEQERVGRTQPAAAALVRPLSRRYLFVLLGVAALVIVDQAIIQPSLIGLNLYAPTINLAGRQRMLSQKISKESLALAVHMTAKQAAPEFLAVRRAELRSSIQQWTVAHRALTQGDSALGIEPLESPALRAEMQQLTPAFHSIVTAAGKIAEPDSADSDRSHQLSIILANDPKFLAGMERVVALLTQSARERVSFLRAGGLAAMVTILGLITVVYFIVLRPAATVIRGQIAALDAAREKLEVRVAARTHALSATNAALALEIAERHAAEARMRDLADQLAHASRVTALGQLATGLAHEINQPLASIASYADTAELLLENREPDLIRSRQAIVQIRQAALRGGNIVRRMRNFVRRGTVQAQTIEINELVREVCDLCRPQLDQAGVNLSVEMTPEAVVASADPLEVQQVLVNLLQNAAQSVQTCPRELRSVALRTRVVVNEVWVEIADSGPGFIGQSAEECFAAFFSTKPDGLGLGLAVCRTLLARYQGRIWAEDTVGAGATLVFSLPLQSTHDVKPSDAGHCVCG